MTDRPQRVSEIGEFALIDRLARLIGPATDDVVLGIGDDVAALTVDARRLLLLTCDAQVEGTHFETSQCDPLRLGRKAAAINLSDVAAAGGRPGHFLVSLVLPPHTPLAFIEAVYTGLVAEARRFGAGVVGGNVSSGDRLVIDLTLIGDVGRDELLRRSGARAGDRVLLTGTLGAAAAGLRLLQDPQLRVSIASRERALAAFETPTARIAESEAAVAVGGVSAAVDVSDGLAADIGHLCEASGVGVELEANLLPVDPAAVEVGTACGVDPLRMALAGGEDYELVFCASAESADALIDEIGGRTGTAVTRIGRIVDAARGCRLIGADDDQPLDTGGWRHF